MNQLLSDYLRDAAEDALELFRDLTRDDYTETELLAGLILNARRRGGDSVSQMIAAAELLSWSALSETVELGGTKGGEG